MKFFKLFLLSLGIVVSLHSCQQDLDYISDEAQLKMNEQSIAIFNSMSESFNESVTIKVLPN